MILYPVWHPITNYLITIDVNDGNFYIYRENPSKNYDINKNYELKMKFDTPKVLLPPYCQPNMSGPADVMPWWWRIAATIRRAAWPSP